MGAPTNRLVQLGNRILIVGAGLAGAALARTLAEGGFGVLVIDKREHVAGNCYDEVNEYGERIHRYGPHLLHGREGSRAVRWLSQFTDWVPYEHRVRALVGGGSGATTPLPINATTLESMFSQSFGSEAEVREFLRELRGETNQPPKNADEFFLQSVGRELANLFLRPYTRKMWNREPAELGIEVAKRISVRLNRDDRYFTDSFQALPQDGYTALVDEALRHPNITVSLRTAFERPMVDKFSHSFLAIPPDEYFDYKYGELPYRAIRFHVERRADSQDAPVVNFTDDSPYTRVTQWDLFPNSGSANANWHTVTLEEPCDPRDVDEERYYPVRNRETVERYRRYQAAAARESSKVTFCGRAALFAYIDMVPTVEHHLRMANRFIEKSNHAKK